MHRNHYHDGFWRNQAELSGNNRKYPARVVTTLFGSARRHPLRKAWKNRRFCAGPAGPGFFTPNMGYGRVIPLIRGRIMNRPLSAAGPSHPADAARADRGQASRDVIVKASTTRRTHRTHVSSRPYRREPPIAPSIGTIRSHAAPIPAGRAGRSRRPTSIGVISARSRRPSENRIEDSGFGIRGC